MENRLNHNQPEEQGWGAYATPPRHTGLPPETTATTALCAQVVEILPALVENDGTVRPEMAAAIYAHLAACAVCAREFDALQRVVKLVESLAPVELPMDFSGLIMHRIQTEMGPARSVPDARPTVAVSSSGEAAEPAVRTTQSERIAAFLNDASATRLHADTASLGLQMGSLGQTQKTGMERFTAAGVLLAVMAFCLSTAWGRTLLGVNLSGAATLAGQVQATLEGVPLLGGLVSVIFAALAGVGHLLQETYRNLGSLAVRGLLVDVALCAAAYYFLTQRRNRNQLRGVGR